MSALSEFISEIKNNKLEYSKDDSVHRKERIRRIRKWHALEKNLATDDITLLNKKFEYCSQCELFIFEIPERKIKKKTKSVLEDDTQRYCPICETYIF